MNEINQHYLDDVNFDFAEDEVDSIRIWPLFIALLFALIIYSWVYVVKITEPNIIYVPPQPPQSLNGFVVPIAPGWTYGCITIDLSYKTIVGNRDCSGSGIKEKLPPHHHSLNNDAAAVVPVL